MTPMTTNDNFCTPAWLLLGWFGSQPGVLELKSGRLSFVTEESRVFNVARDQITNIEFPWYYLGCGVKFKAGADSYRVSFAPSESSAGVPQALLDKFESDDPQAFFPNDGNLVEGRRAGKALRSALKV